MYFKAKSGPMQGAGAYHKTEPVVSISGLGQTPGYAPILSPYFAQAKPYPYILGPNYTRPVFREHSRAGNFRVQPIVRMPSLSGLRGLGSETIDELPADVSTPMLPPEDGTGSPVATPETVCDAIRPFADAHSKCLSFNKRYMTADAAEAVAMTQAIEQARVQCQNQPTFAAWADCYYGKVQGAAWWKNPLMLGAAVLAGLAAVSVAVTIANKDEY